jgi:hypothetical protein
MSFTLIRRRRWIAVVLAIICSVVAGIGLGVGTQKAQANSAGSGYYAPSSSNEVLSYNRIIRLQHSGAANGTLIGTFEHATLDGSAAHFLIRKSTDDGSTWSTISTLSDPLTGTGHPADHMWEPSLFEFPTSIGDYAAGTLILVGDIETSVSTSTNFVDWRSTDGGATWTYVSDFQTGGAPGAGIWEPFLALDSSGNLNCYFSDERQNGTYSQKLAHVVSTDGGATWSANRDGSTRVAPGEVNDVASSSQSDRPGMATIAKNNAGLYVMSYEICGSAYNCEAFTKTSTTGNSWGSGPTDLGTAVVTSDGRTLFHSPFIAWSPAGGANGEFLLAGQNESGGSENQQVIFVNTANDTGAWSWIPAPLLATGSPTANCDTNYSPDLLPSADGESIRYTAASNIGPYGCEEVTGQTNAGVLPVNSTFAGGDSGWIDYGGCWSASGVTYAETCGGSSGPKAVAGSTGWGDYTLSGDVEMNSGTQAGFMVRVTNPASGTDALSGYYINVTPSQIALARENNSWTPLTNTSIPGGLALNSWYHLTIQVVGCTLTVAGVPVGSTAAPVGFTYTDSGCSFTHGAIGLRDQGSTATWRNVTVTPGGTTSGSSSPYLAPFASGTASGWTTYGGSWSTSASSEALSDTSGGSGDKAVAGSTGWTNYSLSGDVELGAATGSSPNAGLLARVTNPAVGADSLDGYYVGVDATSLILGKESYGWTVLGAATLPVTLSTSTWYHLTVQVVGCQITATGQPSSGGSQVSVTTTDTGCSTTSGAVGVRTFDSAASWRDITVTPR